MDSNAGRVARTRIDIAVSLPTCLSGRQGDRVYPLSSDLSGLSMIVYDTMLPMEACIYTIYT